MLRLTFNHGLVLKGFLTTRPWLIFHRPTKKEMENKISMLDKVRFILNTYPSPCYNFTVLLQVSRMFYEWREALTVTRKQTQLIDGQMVHHNRRVKQGCMAQWKKFTLRSRAERHCNKSVTAKVWKNYVFTILLCSVSKCNERHTFNNFFCYS